jgi:hypothetical protein
MTTPRARYTPRRMRLVRFSFWRTNPSLSSQQNGPEQRDRVIRRGY